MSGYALGYFNSNTVTGTGTHPPSINLPQKMVTDNEDISKAIKKYTTMQPSTKSIGSDTTPLTIFNHVALTKNVNHKYLYKGNPHILMTRATMKPFNTGISDP